MTGGESAIVKNTPASILCRKMSSLALTQPLVFEPIFMERVWGGRRLEEVYGKRLPAGIRIGESWEIVDRPEAQSVVREGSLRGKTLHELWLNHRAEIFGNIPDASRFPLLIKLLDAREKLSVQVHPPNELAAELGGEAKTEFWYIADADPGAELFVGLREGSSRERFEQALKSGQVADHVHRIAARTGDAMFLPSGRVHAIGGGNLIVEIQQNSDTTYRVFDWNRTGTDGKPRELHVEHSLRCIDFDDCQPSLTKVQGELLVRDPLFEIQKWTLREEREVVPAGTFAIVFCLTSKIQCGGLTFSPGEFFLLPATAKNRTVCGAGSELLRISLPD
jgi:mannose-6-phosphate isomerase